MSCVILSMLMMLLSFAQGEFEVTRQSTGEPGDHWHVRLSPNLSVVLHAVAKGENKWVSVGDDGQILYSTDGILWSDASQGERSRLYDVTWAGSFFLAVGWNGEAYR